MVGEKIPRIYPSMEGGVIMDDWRFSFFYCTDLSLLNAGMKRADRMRVQLRLLEAFK